MQDGKTPLFIWLSAWTNPFFNNFLFSARFISVIASAINVLCWSIICGKILGKKSALLFFIITLLTPFNILIARLAFVDSLLVAFGSLSFLALFFVKESLTKLQIFRGIFFAFAAGVFLGLAFFTKTTAKIFLAAEILLLIFWILQSLKLRKIKQATALLISGGIITGIYFEMLGYLKFGALRHWEMIANKESVLVFSLPELYRKFFIEHNFGIHIKNIPISLEYIFFYFGPILVFFVLGVIWILKTKKHFWILLLVILLSSGVLLSAKVPASRYFSIVIPEVMVIACFGLVWLWQKNLQPLKIFSIALLILSGFLSAKNLFDPLNAFYSSDDRANFVDYNLNALGLNESVELLSPKKKTVAVLVSGIWGVSEGSQVAFQEKGIETYVTPRIVNSHPKETEPCEDEFKELEGKCWKINFGDLTNSTKNEKYIYFINEDIDIETLTRLEKIEVVKTFTRPKTNLNVYLLKLNP